MNNTERTTSLEDEPTGSGSAASTGSALTKLKGIAGMMISTLMLATSGISVQALDRSVPDFELNAMRCGFAMICMIFYFIFTRTFPRVSRTNILPVLLLSLVNNLVTIGIYVSVTFIPIATSECLIFTAKLVAGLLVYKLCNKEQLKWDKVIAAPLCVIGVFLVLQPPGIFPEKDNAEINSQLLTASNGNMSNETLFGDQLGNNTDLDIQEHDLDHESEGDLLLGYVIAACTGLLFSFEVSVVKYYADFFTPRNLFLSLIWSYSLGTIMSLIPMLVFEHPVFPSKIKGIMYVCAHVCMYVLLMPLYLHASLLISGNLVSITSTSILLFLLAAQYTILKDIHPGHRNWIEILGVILVLFGNIFSSLMEIFRGCKTNKETSED